MGQVASVTISYHDNRAWEAGGAGPPTPGYAVPCGQGRRAGVNHAASGGAAVCVRRKPCVCGAEALRVPCGVRLSDRGFEERAGLPPSLSSSDGPCASQAVPLTAEMQPVKRRHGAYCTPISSSSFFFFSIEVQRLWLMAFSFAKLFRVVTPLCVFDGNSTPGRQV